MEQFILVMKEKGAKYIGGVSAAEIKQAEEKLQFNFPEQYKKFLSELGIISLNGHEVFGLGTSGYLNVVESTLEEQQFEEALTTDYIVIENMGSEGILILLHKDGMVYECANGSVKLIFNSLVDYLNQEVI
ncbi:SMI1/KNR4 family protein [Bacillus cereus]|uniref:SMI1/KNR4 family protein n=1 Tax=Bacillus cereus TaxID=1396 RepID=UPI00256FC27B|nr:SMI1/KNR4 family protein [Bacillus cereus]MDM5461102.1 SMI1/KNR4 family protein [Bacillus cereus]WJE27018.1 SMI1/KNR4 family protein [Bacillus cereus]